MSNSRERGIPFFMEPLEIEKFVQDASIRLAEELAIKLNGLREN